MYWYYAWVAIIVIAIVNRIYIGIKFNGFSEFIMSDSLTFRAKVCYLLPTLLPFVIIVVLMFF